MEPFLTKKAVPGPGKSPKIKSIHLLKHFLIVQLCIDLGEVLQSGIIHFSLHTSDIPALSIASATHLEQSGEKQHDIGFR